MNKPYSIKIFLPGGDPDGLRTIEKSNWSGSGLVFQRTLLNEARLRKELGRTGVYVLVGPSEDSGLPRVYVGEGDPIRPRLEQHDSKRDFWTSCIAFTSKDENLNKAHVQFLESRLVSLAREAKRCVLENGNAPQLPSMSEADAADADGFLAEMMLCFPLLGVSVFSSGTVESRAGHDLFLKGKNAEARGMESPQGFIVRSGSIASSTEVPSCHGYVVELRAALLKNGVLKPVRRGFEFTQDYPFSAPSTAAAVVLGRTSNGRIEWKTKDGKTLKELQELSPS
jgi:hypothetical protein